MKRIGVFSGTFDPFHIGHLEACIVAKEACDLESTAIVLEHQPNNKQGVTNYYHRLQMIDLAIQKFPSIQLLEAPNDNITFMNIWPILQQRWPEAEYWYILGSDLLNHIDSWQDIDEMTKQMKLCVFLRSNKDRRGVTDKLQQLQIKLPHLRYKLLPEVWSEVSSSKIRTEIKRLGFSDKVDTAVMDYISANSIY